MIHSIKVTTRLLIISTLAIHIFVHIGCDNKRISSHEIPVLRFDDALETRHEIALSEIVDSLFLIKLETSDDCVIGNFQKVIYSDNYILLSQVGRPLFIFNNKGKFIREVGLIGRGPGELPRSYDFTFNRADSTLLFTGNTGNSFSVYTLNGDYLYDIKPEKDLHYINFVSDNLFFSQLFLGASPDTARTTHILFDHKGEIVRRYKIQMNIPENNADELLFVITTPIINITSNSIHFYTSFNDTIFSIDENGRLTESLSWVRGEFNPPRFRNYLLGLGKAGPYWCFALPIPGAGSGMFIFDERNGELFSVSQIVNDIDGTVVHLPLWSKVYNNTFTEVYTPSVLKSKLEKGHFNNENIRYPDRNKQFKELINTLNEEDNPVVAIYKLK